MYLGKCDETKLIKCDINTFGFLLKRHRHTLQQRKRNVFEAKFLTLI